MDCGVEAWWKRRDMFESQARSGPVRMVLLVNRILAQSLRRFEL